MGDEMAPRANGYDESFEGKRDRLDSPLPRSVTYGHGGLAAAIRPPPPAPLPPSVQSIGWSLARRPSRSTLTRERGAGRGGADGTATTRACTCGS